MLFKKYYDKGFADGLASRDRVITFEDQYKFRMEAKRELPKEDLVNIRDIVNDPRFESVRKQMLYEAMSHYEQGRDQPEGKRHLFDEIGRFAENCVQVWDSMKEGTKPASPDEWNG